MSHNNKFTSKVEKTADFLRNQPFLLAKYDNFAPFHFGFTEFQIQSETLLKM